MKTIAVIFTCYNRKEKTRKCLDAIYNSVQRNKEKLLFSIYVCDDGSTDGTDKILHNYKMNIHVVNGGNLFWAKGMYVAMQLATKSKHDYYLMINDDVDFFDDFIDDMINSYNLVGRSCGISGPTKAKGQNVTTYGGSYFRKKGMITPNGHLQKCDLANWNCFLVDQEIINTVGLIDPQYAHSFGDYDYTMAMKRKGYEVFLTERYIGECNRNGCEGTFKDNSLPIKKRMRLLFSPKGMHFKSGLRYRIKNIDYLGTYELVCFFGAYAKNILLIFAHK